MVIIFWLSAWAISSRLAGLPFLLPGPLDTLKKMMALWATGSFWFSLLISLMRVLIGFISAVIFGVLMAAICAILPAADDLMSPVKSIIRSTPVSSFIILVLLWLSAEITPIFIAFLAVMPIIWQDVQQGIAQVPSDLLEMGRAYHFSKKRMIINIYIPSVAPYFYTACASGMGFAWKAAIAAEVIARPLYSVGKNLQDAKVYLETEELFAWTFTVVMLSMILEAGIKRLTGHQKEKETGE